MSTFYIKVAGGCSLNLVVEADTEDEARLAAGSAMRDHLAECDGVWVESCATDTTEYAEDFGRIYAIPGISEYDVGYGWQDPDMESVTA